MSILGGLIGSTRSMGSGSNTETIVEVVPSIAKLSFSVSDGVDFTLYHGLGNSDLILQMFAGGEMVLPNLMQSSDPDHIHVQLGVPMNGTILILAAV